MNYSVAIGSMRLISNIGRKGFLDGLGVSRGDFDRLVGDDAWMAVDRGRMTNCLHTVINASVDALGLPRFNLPAEYVAAGIALFVSPVNIHAACVYSAGVGNAEDMGRMAQVTPATPDQLFALVIQLYKAPDRTAAVAQFEKHTALNLDKVSQPQGADSGKKC